jgi:hypothetical protein
MSASVLKKLNRRAKELVAKKGISYKAAQKQAGREMRGGKVSGVKKKAAKRSKKSVVRKRAVGSVRAKAVGTVSHHLGEAKKLIRERLASALLRRDMATTKVSRRKAAKDIAALKKQYKALC